MNVPKENRRGQKMDRWVKLRLDEKTYNVITDLAMVRRTYRSVVLRDAIDRYVANVFGEADWLSEEDDKDERFNSSH